MALGERDPCRHGLSMPTSSNLQHRKQYGNSESLGNIITTWSQAALNGKKTQLNMYINVQYTLHIFYTYTSFT